ncbi:MAG: ANTAR domain-containing protein [Treponemataceae bacterium]|nr:ANTAR domain-containing protein [Treponema sp.]MBD5409803.1 ANTAR domain-containing protein [Treponema sp.]MBD5412840.1 ANTAR domain-containing protein [Treponema sp.]MBD5443878.1 ANTAR domain-containing protein [Treponema sp.]MDE7383247.1 ANTAR domain-containing protein [Treponemataceae bacterium]
MKSDITSVLLVTKDNKISSSIMQMLVSPLFEVTICSDFNEARRKVNEVVYKIIIVDLGDDSDAAFAVDISDTLSTILLLTPNSLFDHISYRVESYGILTITKPFDAFYFYNIIKIALAVQAKIQRISSQNVKLKVKMEEIRIINHAKMLLIQHRQMTEDDAHHFIERVAMDKGLKKINAAQEIIIEFESYSFPSHHHEK